MMALEVEKSPSDASLNVQAKCCDRWNYMDLEREYPELVITRVGPPLDVKEGWLWLRGAEDDEEPAAVEGAGHAALGLPERHPQNPSALPSGPSSSFSKSKATAKDVESQPLICRSARSSDVPFHFSRGGLHPEEQQIFCGQLEELIHWLHKIADVTDNWIPPRPDIESIKTSLQNYLEFKKDLAGHHALIQDVLQDGERLLKYMASDSPVLQNTLRLIAQQSNELENHAEHLYESIVAAMDALGAGLMKDCDAQQIAASAESSK